MDLPLGAIIGIALAALPVLSLIYYAVQVMGIFGRLFRCLSSMCFCCCCCADENDDTVLDMEKSAAYRNTSSLEYGVHPFKPIRIHYCDVEPSVDTCSSSTLDRSSARNYNLDRVGVVYNTA